MNTGYKALDDAIKAHIVLRPGHHPIYSTPLLDMAAMELGRAAYKGDDKEWRLIDRRMQAMRKAGLLVYKRIRGSHGRWLVVDAQREQASA